MSRVGENRDLVMSIDREELGAGESARGEQKEEGVSLNDTGEFCPLGG